MANNSLSSIRGALSTHLAAVVTSGELKQLKTGRDSDHSAGFPFARYYLVGIESELLTNQPANFRTYKFRIDIIQENTNKTKADAEADLETAVDAVLDKLDAEWQLKVAGVATVDNTEIEVSPCVETEINSGPALMQVITLRCRTLVY